VAKVSQERWIDPRFAGITAGVVAVILYGSLYPFQFHDDHFGTGPFKALFANWRQIPDWSDIVSNVLLYIPFGLFAIRSLLRPRPFVRILLVACAALVISTSVELMQFYDRFRDTDFIDVCTNTAGGLLGAIAGAVFRRHLRLPLIGDMEWRPFVILLFACWLGYRFFPHSPAVQPANELPIRDIYRQSAVWLAIGVMLETVFGIVRSRWAILLLVPAMLFARTWIAGAVLSPAEVIGGVLGGLSWIAVFSRLRIRNVLVVVLFAGAVVIQALEPFKFAATPHPFQWIPFIGFMEGPRETGIGVFFEKTFTYGALVWLTLRAGCSLRIAAIFGAALVLSLRLTQVYLPGRSAEITDSLMLLILAGLMKVMGERPLTVTQTARRY
jgi:glycopeptide antibiotics resistance protein